MTRKTIVGGAVLTGLMAILLVASGPALAQARNSDGYWQAMQRCAQIADPSARHICTDAVMTSAGVLNSSQSAAPAQPSSTQPGTPQAPATPVQPQAQAPQAPAVRQQATVSPIQSFIRPKPAPEDQPSRIEVTLASVDATGNGKFVLTSTDGTVWRQLYTKTMPSPPRAGDSMSVHKNSLGGFICRVGKKPSFRCAPTS